MKLLTTFTLGVIATTSLFAQTTMCFKESHTSMATIETTPLDGGLCSSSKSVAEMKKEGWSVDDIKIESTSKGKNYIYIFKKDEQTISSFDEKQLEEKILQKLEKRKEQEQKIKITKYKEAMSKSGKKMFIDKCQSCHGEKAEKRAYNTSRPLIELSFADMDQSINDYMYDNYDRGNALVMKPYAIYLTNKKLKDIYSYIQTLKPQKENEGEESK